MRDWLRTATQPTIVRRALWCMLIVGAILTTINHGAALLHGDVTGQRLLQIGLTLLVPYCVSTYSSVSALRSSQAVAQLPGTSRPATGNDH